MAKSEKMGGSKFLTKLLGTRGKQKSIGKSVLKKNLESNFDEGYAKARAKLHKARIEAQYKLKKRFRPGMYQGGW